MSNKLSKPHRLETHFKSGKQALDSNVPSIIADCCSASNSRYTLWCVPLLCW